MNDTALIEKKLAYIETCVRELRELARPDRLDGDLHFTASVRRNALNA